MTEHEREELIEKMVRAMWYIEPNNNTLMIDELARAALAVAEPVIREQVELELREENARLREAVKNAYYEGWQDNASREYSRQEIQKDWETSEARAAIREESESETPMRRNFLGGDE